MNVEDRIENAKKWGDAMHANVASAELLLEIRDLLKAQMAGAKPSMPVITPARRPAVEDTPVVDAIPNKDHKGMITFPCAARPMTDSITIDTNHTNGFYGRLFIDFDVENEDEKSIGLSMDDARQFAKAILREVGE